MRLILLPVSPLGNGGYNKAVVQDIARLNINRTDHVIIYNHPGQVVPAEYDYIVRPPLFSFSRLLNTLSQRVSTDLPPQLLLNKIKGNTYKEIFCGDVMLYRAARLLFPRIKLTVRFHNLFFLSNTRNLFRSMPISFKFRFNMYFFSKLERDILRDKNVIPIFINETEQSFFELMYPGHQCKIWSPQLPNQLLPNKPNKHAFIYLGSYAHHQTPGILWFIKNVFRPLKNRDSRFTVHFWGAGGGFLNNPKNGVYYHGDYKQSGLPMVGDGLFINPDLLGGGIKFKIAEWLETGVPFISTPFGVEGYKFQQNENIIIAETDDWLKQIATYFKLQSR